MTSEKRLLDEEFVVLVGRLERRVRAFIRTLILPNQGQLDDLVQATLLVAWKRLHSFSYEGDEPDEELMRWLCGIARLEVRNARRRWGKSCVVFSDQLVERLADRLTDSQQHLNDRHTALGVCIQKLGVRDRQLIHDKYEQGMTAREIGSHRRRTEVAVLNALSRLRGRLRACIEQRLRREEQCG